MYRLPEVVLYIVAIAVGGCALEVVKGRTPSLASLATGRKWYALGVCISMVAKLNDFIFEVLYIVIRSKAHQARLL